MTQQTFNTGRSVDRTYHWYQNYRLWLSLLAIAGFLLVATIALDPSHEHAANARSCEICLAAHLPFVQPAVTPVLLALTPSQGEGILPLVVRHCGISVLAAESRGPPALASFGT